MKTITKIFLALLVAVFSVLNVNAQTLGFTYSPSDTIYVGDTVTFTNTSTGFDTTVRWVWNYGDYCSVQSFDTINYPLAGCNDTLAYNVMSSIFQYQIPGGKEVTLTALSMSDDTLDVMTLTLQISMVPCICLNPVCDLIDNGDFECNPTSWNCTPTTPTNNNPQANFTLLCNWTSPNNATPDYYYPCTTNCPLASDCWVPENPVGCSEEFSGKAYVGLGALIWLPGFNVWEQYHEYIQQQLNFQMNPGQSYQFVIRVRRANKSDFVTNGLQAVFTTGPMTAVGFGIPLPGANNWELIDIIPTLNWTLNAIPVVDMWTEYTFTFTPLSGYNFITIGNFKADPGNSVGVWPYLYGANPNVVNGPFIAPVNPVTFGQCWPCNALYNCSAGSNPKPFCYFYIDKVELIPSSPQVAITGFHNTCVDANSNSTFSATVTGGAPPFIYNWTFSNGFSNFTQAGNSITVTNWAGFTNGAATLCVTVTDANGCPDTDCIPVFECCDECKQDPTTYTINNLNVAGVAAHPVIGLAFFTFPITNGFELNLATAPSNPPKRIIVNGTFEVDQNFTFRNAESICFAPEARIIVHPNCTLIFEDCGELIASSCPLVIDGIVIANKIMWDGIYLEDVSSQLIMNPTFSGSGYHLDVREAKNPVVSQNGGDYQIQDVILQHNNKDIVMEQFNGTQNSFIKHCRLFSYPAYMLPYYTYAPPFPNPNPPVLNPALPRTHTGVEINDNFQFVTIGDGTNPAYQNTFEYMDYGIHCINSSLQSFNNFFTDIRSYAPACKGTGCPPPKGICIYSEQIASNVNMTIVGGNNNPDDPNIFDDCSYGVFITGGWQDNTITWNTFDDVNNGIRVEHCKGPGDIDIIENDFDKFYSAINLTDNGAAHIDIGLNDFNANYTTTQQSTAIYVGEPQAISHVNTLNIHDNDIFRVTNGIHLVNERSIFYNSLIVNSNNIYFGDSHPSNWFSYGLKIRNSSSVWAGYNSAYRCLPAFTQPPMGMNPGNWVQALFPAGYVYPTTAPTQSRLTGISSETSSMTTMMNNYIGYLGTGIRCFNLYMPNYLNCNVMGYNQIGVWLDNDPNPGAPGEQGFASPGYASDNRWNIGLNSNFTPFADIFGPPPTAIGDIWYLRPTANGYEFEPQILNVPGIVNLQAVSPINPDCSYTIPQLADLDALQKALADIIRTTRIEDIAMTEQQIFFTQLDVYKELMYNDTLLNIGTTPNENEYLQAFYDSAGATDIGAMASVKFLLGENDTTGASIANSQITPDNQAEENEQVTNEIYLATWAQDIYALDSLQDTTLSAIAAQNPLSGGPAVYVARAMLGVDYDDFGPEEENRLEANNSERPKYIHVYPNPASDELNVDYSLGENELGLLSVTDLLGREIMNEKLHSSQKSIKISTKDIEDGMYFLRLIVNNELIGLQKLLIAR
ncbi:MAG TPA: T9SS type A sorting domain-containing protein [Bacteroidia bacterium]|nr:T9SS type A sorting domain-containing protein [Bacteroidia bacterium]